MRYTIYDIPILRDVLQVLTIILLWLFGWRRAGRLPDGDKFVIIAAPHTSNWDFPIGLVLILAFKVKIYWLGKDRFLGGLSLRSSNGWGEFQ